MYPKPALSKSSVTRTFFLHSGIHRYLFRKFIGKFLKKKEEIIAKAI